MWRLTVLAAALPLTAILAEATSEPWITPLVQAGPVGVLVVLVLTGYLHTRGDYESVVKDRDAARAELADLRRGMDERFLPLVQEMIGLLRSKDADREQQILMALERLQHQRPRDAP